MSVEGEDALGREPGRDHHDQQVGEPGVQARVAPLQLKDGGDILAEFKRDPSLKDVPIIVLAALGAFVLRFDWFFASFQRELVRFAIAAVLVKPIVFYAFGLYSRFWRYASGRDMLAVVLAVSTS